MRRFVVEVFARHRGLGLVGGLNLAAAGAFLLLMLVDETTVLGINRWIKPFKFAMSVGIYVWTVAWFLPYLRIGKRIASLLGWAIAIVMLFENGLIFLQAIRGTASHFNTAAPFDETVFALMGVMILFNSIFVVVLLLLFLLRPADAPRPWIWSIRIGLFLLLLGSAQGAYMIGAGGHSVGAPDGGPGLPVVHWQTDAGDLRPAHLIGLHGVQLIPLFAWGLGRTRLSEKRQLALVFAVSAAYALIGVALFWQATRGMPLLPI